jgi:hypothetical protein
MQPHYHACGFFNSRDEEYEVLLPYVREGMEYGEKSVHVTDPALRADHLRRIADAGIDVVEAEQTRQLEVLDWHSSYLKGGSFNPDSMIVLFERVIHESLDAGFPRTRIIGHMEWALEKKPGVERLVEYEARVNQVLVEHRQPAVCAYDVSQFPASTMLEILRVHPLVIIAGVLQENPFFVPPDEYLRTRLSA